MQRSAEKEKHGEMVAVRPFTMSSSLTTPPAHLGLGQRWGSIGIYDVQEFDVMRTSTYLVILWS